MSKKRSFRHFRWAYTVHHHCDPHNKFINQMEAEAAWWQKRSALWEHCAAYNLKRSFWQRNDTPHTFYTMKRKRTELWIMWRERPLWLETAFKMQRQRIMQQQEDMRNVQKEGRTTRIPEKSLEEMMHAIVDSLCDLSSSNDEEDGKAEDNNEEDLELEKLREYDEPGLVMGTISNTVQRHMESIHQMQMTLDELAQPGWGDAADHFCERDRKYRTAKVKVLAVVKPQSDRVATVPALTTLGERMQTVDGVPGQSQMLQGTSWPGRSHMRLGSKKVYSHKCIRTLSPDILPNLSTIKKSKPVCSISLYPSI